MPQKQKSVSSQQIVGTGKIVLHHVVNMMETAVQDHE